MATHIRCYACRDFFSTKERRCVSCGAPRRARNSYLETVKLNNHLFAQAESADNQRKQEIALRKGRDVKPEPWAYKQAGELMDRM